jgi:hypothetical protein
VHELINSPSINLYLNKPGSVFSFTEEEEVEKEMGERDGEEKSALPSQVTSIQQQNTS